MSKKSVTLTMKQKASPKAEQWVASTSPVTGAQTRRLTIELPAELHAKIKAHCALKQQNMAGVFRAIIEREFASVKPKM
jgi:hypothetical protein